MCGIEEIERKYNDGKESTINYLYNTCNSQKLTYSKANEPKK